MAQSLVEKYPELDVNKRSHQNAEKLARKLMRNAFRPSRERESLITWAEENVRLKGARPGPIDLELTPHMIEPYKAADFNSKVTDIVLMFGSQMGKSTFCEIATGFYIAIGTGNIGYAAANDELLDRIRETRINNILETVPEIAEKLTEVKEEKGAKKAKDSVKLLNFGNAYLCFMSLQSTTAMSNIDCQILVLEEVRDAPVNLKNQGCPVKIIDKRRTTYMARSKRLIPSTPSLKNDSNPDLECKVWREFKRGSMEYWKVPCPHCGHYHQLSPENAVIDEVRDLYGFSCPECGGLIEEDCRDSIVSRGKYFAENPKMINSFRSFHCNQYMTRQGIGSPWKQLLTKWKQADGNESEKITLTNTDLGLPYSRITLEADWEKLKENKYIYLLGSLPTNCPYITVGVDFQQNWIEANYWGWDLENRSYFCKRSVYEGIDWENPAGTIAPVIRAIASQSFRVGEFEMYACAGFLDIGYQAEKIAYSYALAGSPANLRFIKGESKDKDTRSNLGQSVFYLEGEKQEFNRVNVFQSKRNIYHNFKLKNDQSGYCHFPHDCPDEIFQQLTSEHETTNKSGTQKIFERKSRYVRNEVLDCFVYATLARDFVLVQAEKFGGVIHFAERFIRSYNEVRHEVKKESKPKDKIQTVNYGDDDEW